MDIGKNIKRYRQEFNMTQEKLAELLNISVSAVSQWESEKTIPDISLIPTLCNLFHVSSDVLLGINIQICTFVSGLCSIGQAHFTSSQKLLIR